LQAKTKLLSRRDTITSMIHMLPREYVGRITTVPS